jgi:hypothetical protein
MEKFDVRRSDKFCDKQTGTGIDEEQNVTCRSVVQNTIIFEQNRTDPQLMWFKWCRPDYQPISGLVYLLNINRGGTVYRSQFWEKICVLKNYLNQEEYPLRRESNVMDLILKRVPSDNYIQGFNWYQNIDEQTISRNFDSLLSSFKERLDNSERAYLAHLQRYVPQQREPNSPQISVDRERVVEFLNRMAFNGHQYWKYKAYLYFCATGTPHPYESATNSLMSEIGYWSEKTGII